MRSSNFSEHHWLIFLVMLTTTNLFSQVMVSGNCQLEGALLYNDTQVIFEAASPSAVSDTAITDNSGDFNIPLNPGIYNIIYTHTGYIPYSISDIFINTEITLDPIALYPPIDINGYCVLEGETSHQGTKIIFVNVESNLRDTVWTNVVGRYEAYLDRVEYEITYEHEDFVPQSIMVEINNPGTLSTRTLNTFPSGIVITEANIDSVSNTSVFLMNNYIISETVVLRNADVFSIEPGTKFYFQDGASINVDTSNTIFHAEGTEQDSIYFLTYPGESASTMLYMSSDQRPATRVFNYCVFLGNSRTHEGIQSWGAGNHSTIVNNSRFSNFTSSGISVHGYGEANIYNCNFYKRNIYGDVLHLFDAFGIVSGCTFETDNTDNINEGNVVYLQGGPFIFSNNSIHMAGGGHHTAISSMGGPLTITRNVITHNNSGWGVIYLFDGENVEFSNNILVGTPSSHDGIGLICGSGELLIRNNIFYKTKIPIQYPENNGNATIQYNCISGFEELFTGGAIPGVGDILNFNDSTDAYLNVYKNPQFIDESSGDFHLSPQSPCIDAGDPNTELDPDGSIADIGVFPTIQGPHPVLTISNSVMNFGNVEINISDSLVLTITNSGDLDLIIDVTELVGDGFQKEILAPSQVLNPAASIDIKVFFNPTELLDYSATFRVESNDRDVEITCYGNGVPPSGTQATSLFIAGGGDVGQNWDYFNSNTLPSMNNAYSVLSYGRYYGDTRITYLNPIGYQDWDGDGIDDNIVDIDLITSDTLRSALQSLVDEDNQAFPNVLFFAGHGYTGEIDINGNAADNVPISVLDDWVDSTDLALHTPLIMLFEACFSGSYIPTLADSNRVIISACRADQFADYLDGQCFSTRFWEEIWYGNSLADAFSVASDWSQVFLNAQEPQLDADGNGISNEATDFAIADTIYLGGVYQHGAVLPEIVEAPEFMNTVDGEIEVPIRFNRSMDNVWCVLYPVDYSGTPEVEELPRINLSRGDNFIYSGTFESISPFSGDQDLEVIVYGVADLYNTIVPHIISVFPGSASATESPVLPTETSLNACFPNPFNATISLSFQIAEESQLGLNIYDIKGRRIKQVVYQDIMPGTYQQQWNGLNDYGQAVSSGIYIVQLVTEDYAFTRKVTLLK
jgi:hypothetical protein